MHQRFSRRLNAGSWSLVGAAWLVLAGGAPAWAQPQEQPKPSQLKDKPEAKPKDEKPKKEEAVPKAEAGDLDGPSLRVTKFVMSYATEHPSLPRLADAMNIPITLGRGPDGYVAPRAGGVTRTIRLSDVTESLPASETTFSVGAINEVCKQVFQWFSTQGIIGVFCAPSAEDLLATAEDLASVEDKREGRTTLSLVVTTAVVKQIRSVAAGERIASAERINNAAHDRIRRHSPVAAPPGGPSGKGDLIRKDLLDDYVLSLNRHPGRRVDVAVSGAGQPGEALLDYLVTENKPWIAYGQVSNTGTEQTSIWRERFGFSHSQLLGFDDIFTLDYVTAGFKESHAIAPSYEFPVGDLDRLRARLYGSWAKFDASEVGFAGEQFSGEDWTGGGEVIWNVFQHRELFLDVVGGARWQHVKVQNKTVQLEGEDDFFLPHAGLRLERFTDLSQTTASINFEWNVADIAATGLPQLERLGRLQPDRSFTLFQWGLTHAFYLEPVLNPEGWGKVEADQATDTDSTLAHELQLSFRGQASLDDRRLVPNFEETVGGFYSVRGYPESAAAGDTVLIGSIEYRMHIPRLFAIEAEPRTLWGEQFRLAPQQVYGRTDWDLIFRTFIDAGRTINSKRQTFERDNTLVGTGVGIEFLFRRNFNVRVDWGVALDEIPDQVKQGSNRFHISATILF
ncbi:MAG: ShlB/FhaC/HecB family hemolysin secretion/activation protein [Phycisphaerae bacterium]|nr:ShlB/FhaC/HecB family hemolysin secretion/activation protein [Phycisphaerae bacterium]